MADALPFRALRYDPARVDLASTIAPPYDVISPETQAQLYRRSAYNVVRVEYGEQSATDTATDNRYTRAAADLARWRQERVLIRDETPAVYIYRQQFSWEGEQRVRIAYFAAVRLEEWDTGIIRPHERTLSGPKADRLDLLRATRAQVSPVYSIFRRRAAAERFPELREQPLYDVKSNGEVHSVSAVYDVAAIRQFVQYLRGSDVYIADGHHRYETALEYRNECRRRAESWSGAEPENFVLMGLTEAGDQGLLVLPTHRLLNPPRVPAHAIELIAQNFSIEDATDRSLDQALERLNSATSSQTRIAAAGVQAGKLLVLTLKDRRAVEATMPPEQPQAWKRLDVNVLQYAILGPVFGVSEGIEAAGSALKYTQDPREALSTVETGGARLAFLLNATPVDQVLAVADAGARMPQKSTYFYPKLPTGIVLRALEG